MKPISTSILAMGALAVLSGSALAQFDELQNYGDARTDGGSAGTFTSAGGVHTITAGGGDFWGNSDNAAFLTASDGSLTTTTDFTASVRHVGTSDPSTNDWGRDPLMMRAQPASGGGFDPLNGGNVNAGAANYALHRTTNNQGLVTGWRDVAGAGYGDNRPGPNPGRPDVAGAYMAISRQGATLRTAWAADLSFGGATGTPGRWIELNNRTHPSIGAGTLVTVGIGHQSHNAITGGGNGQNTGTFDSFEFTDGVFVPALFGPANAADYAVVGSWDVTSDTTREGHVVGQAYTFENGSATGEATGWMITAQQFGDTSPLFGVDNAVNNAVAIANRTADLVPAANFRRSGGGGAGLSADIYLGPNGGNGADNGRVHLFNGGATPNGSTVIPDIWWNGPGNGPANGYPDAGGVSGTDDHGGANNTNLFATAVAGQFTGNQNNYGVDMVGEIFIPDDATRGGREWVAFKDGIDDYTFLEVDGVELIDDNSWTGVETNQNAGGAVSLLDTSDPKYDDGEWVEFRMVMWEGGGGDTCALYWDLDGTGMVNQQPAYPFNRPLLAEFAARGTVQVGNNVNTAAFPGVSLPAGVWNQVTLSVTNTGANPVSQTASNVTVVPSEPFEITDFAYDQVAQTVDLTFNSIPGLNYVVEISIDGVDWSVDIDDSVIGGPGTETTLTGLALPAPESDTLLIRVRTASP